jgi:hypothetical protein
MQSPIDTAQAVPKPGARRAQDTFKVWNRKGHYYLGLYFLFFLWLFAFTGLLLNHSWKFAEFWPSRKVSKFEGNIENPQASSDIERARQIIRQLGISGEVQWTETRPASTLFEFRVSRPGHNYNVRFDPDRGQAAVEHIELNGWGVMHMLHTFSGVRAGDTRNERDWILTTVWVLSMDAVSIGLVLMVFSGLYMWYGLPGKQKLGAAALLLGSALCGVFVFGLRWL